MIMLREPRLAALLTDAVDLALGRACALCDLPGRALCATCLEDIRCVPSPLVLSPLALSPLAADVPSGEGGLPPGRYAVPYRGSASALVLDYKERRNRALAAALGLLLADSVDAVLREDLGRDPTAPPGRVPGRDRGPTPVRLVPIPGHPRPARGFRALPRLLRPAVRCLREAGHPVRVDALVRQIRRHGPLKGMDREERRRAVPGSMAVRPRQPTTSPVIVVDDVVTTGSTMLEAIRALRSAGIPVAGVAAIAHSERP